MTYPQILEAINGYNDKYISLVYDEFKYIIKNYGIDTSRTINGIITYLLSKIENDRYHFKGMVSANVDSDYNSLLLVIYDMNVDDFESIQIRRVKDGYYIVSSGILYLKNGYFAYMCDGIDGIQNLFNSQVRL